MKTKILSRGLRGLGVGLCACLYLSQVVPVAASQVRRPERIESALGVIEGVLQSASGTPLSQFVVVVRHEQTGTTHGSMTSTDGRFVIRGLLPGTYALSASRPGFEDIQLSGIALEPDTTRSLVVEVPDRDSKPVPILSGSRAATPPSEIRRPERAPAVTEPAPVSISAPDFVPITDRWRIALPPWQRYPLQPAADSPYVPGSLWDPYNQNVLKGDYPIFGNRWFLGLTGTSQTTIEGRRGAGVQFSESLIVSADFTHGLTSFRPADLRVRVTPVLNANRRARRWDSALPALQEAFVEARLAATSAAFDFLSVRAGTQPFVSDFRGFVFAGNEPGIRLFGNLRANRHQYNLAYFHLLQKDASTLLNTGRSRRQDVFIANYYIQDFLTPGYTTEFSIHRSRHVETAATYMGWSGDGHWGRLNVNHAFYQVMGRTRGKAPKRSIRAQMAALELSVDRDWTRYRSSFFYASGDRDPNDGIAGGFDAVFDNVNFAGTNASFWNRQDIRLGGTDLGLSERFSLYPALRHGRATGGPNYINPGLFLFNSGVDVEVTTKVRISANLNLLSFADTAVLESILLREKIDRRIGADIGAIVRWRPFLNNNVVLSAGASGLMSGAAFKTLTSPGPAYSAFTELRLTY